MRFCSGRTRSRSVPGINPSAQLDDRHRHAERVVDAGHFQADDAAADHQQPLAVVRQFERAGRIDDARIIRKSGQAHRLGARGDDALLEIDAPDALRADCSSSVCGPTNLASPRSTSTLRCLASTASPLVSLVTTRFFQARSLLAIDRRRREHDAAADMSAASSITLAACKSAFDGMQPTFRHTPPSIGQRSMSVTLRPRSAARKAAV